MVRYKEDHFRLNVFYLIQFLISLVVVIPFLDGATLITGDLSTFNVTFNNSPDPAYIEAVTIAVEEAASAWPSEVVVQLVVNFQAPTTFLGLGFATSSREIDTIFFPIASAEALEGRNLNGDNFDVEIQFSTQNWHTDVNSNPSATEPDLITVALHELMHGLFYVGNYNAGGDRQIVMVPPLVGSFDQYVAIGDANFACAVFGLFDGKYNEPNDEVYRALTSRKVSFLRRTEVGDIFTSLHAPSPFQDFVSVYHISPGQVSSNDQLMAPTISLGTKARTIGPLTRQFMNSILSRNSFKPEPCRPGDWDNRISNTQDGGTGGGNDGEIAGLPATTFYIIIGVSVGVIVVMASIGIYCCCGKDRRKKKNRQGYVSPGGYMSPGYAPQPMYGYGSGYGSGYVSPGGGARGGMYGSGRMGPPPGGMLSPGMYTPGGPRGPAPMSAPTSPRNRGAAGYQASPGVRSAGGYGSPSVRSRTQSRGPAMPSGPPPPPPMNQKVSGTKSPVITSGRITGAPAAGAKSPTPASGRKSPSPAASQMKSTPNKTTTTTATASSAQKTTAAGAKSPQRLPVKSPNAAGSRSPAPGTRSPAPGARSPALRTPGTRTPQQTSGRISASSAAATRSQINAGVKSPSAVKSPSQTSGRIAPQSTQRANPSQNQSTQRATPQSRTNQRK